jgi:hypothetical protein
MVQRSGRIRQKVTPQLDKYVPCHDYILNPDGTVYQDGASGNTRVSRSSGSITYTVRAPGLSKSAANQCMHTMYNFFQSDTAYRFGTVVSNGKTYKLDTHHSFVGISADASMAAAKAAFGYTKFDHLRYYGQGYINDAFYRTKPDLTSVSVPNFLLELDDIPKMWQLWKKKLGVARNLAGARLNWSFGWKPFVGDLKDMIERITNVREQCRIWNKKAGLLEQKSATLLKDSLKANGTISAGYAPHLITWRATSERKVEAFITYQFGHIRALEDAETILKAYLDALGFEANPRIIWDAIPFTFVIDWFFDVGGWMSRFKKDTLELPVLVTDACLQYSENIWVENYWENANNGVYNPRPRSSNGIQREHNFHRMPIKPDSSFATAQGWRTLSDGRLLNLISLATVLWK